MRRAGLLLLLAAAPGLSALAQPAGPSCEPEPTCVGREALSQALEDCASLARTTSDRPTTYAALCRGAAYAFLLAEPPGPDSGPLAQRGYELAARARELEPERVEGHYRYATCLGLYLREHPLSGLTRVADLLGEARRAADLDGAYDRGGPHRLLARIYAEAPRLVGPGDHDLARAHLARLLELAGDDPENQLTAVCVHLELGDDERARRALAAIDPAGLPEPLRRERARLARELE